MGAHGLLASQCNPSLTEKHMELGMEPMSGLQAFPQVREKIFLLYFSFTTGKSPFTHTHLVVTGHPSTISGTFLYEVSFQETISCWLLALPFTLDQPKI